MIKRLPATLLVCGSLCCAAPESPTDTPSPADAGAPRHGTITEKTPSIPQYFTWINNTNEGATAEQTLINLRFFKWLHDEFGMRLGVYAFDAGAIDSQRFYGRMDSERFRRQFPNGFKERNGETLKIPTTSRATVLFAPYGKAAAELAWQAKISISSHPAPNSRLCVALNGEHGKNGAYAALRMDGQWIGAPQRAGSYPAVAFEFPPRSPSSNFTYFFSITQEMRGRSLEVVVLGLAGCDPALKPEVWTTTYPHPYESLEMVLE